MSEAKYFLNNAIVQDIRKKYGPNGRNKITNDGRYGIELEVEYSEPWFLVENATNDFKFFKLHNDGSLRNFGVEFVSKPIAYRELPKVSSEIDVILNPKNSKRLLSPRSSIHIHSNVQHLTYNQLMNQVILYYLIEPALLYFSGKHRDGNYFCLGLEHCSGLSNHLTRNISEYTPFFKNFDDARRYAALNLSAINKFGTLEYRSMRGIDSKEQLEVWLEIIHNLDKLCRSFKNPVEIIKLFSSTDNKGFLEYTTFKGFTKLAGIPETILDRMDDNVESIFGIVSSSEDAWTGERDFRKHPRFLEIYRYPSKEGLSSSQIADILNFVKTDWSEVLETFLRQETIEKSSKEELEDLRNVDRRLENPRFDQDAFRWNDIEEINRVLNRERENILRAEPLFIEMNRPHVRNPLDDQVNRVRIDEINEEVPLNRGNRL